MFCLYLLVFRNRIGFCFIYMYNRYINIYFVAVTCRTQAVSSALLSFSGIHLSHPMPPHFLVLLFWLGPLYNVEILQVEFLSGTTPPTLFKKIFFKEMLLYLHYEIFTLRFLIEPSVRIRKISSSFPRAFKLWMDIEFHQMLSELIVLFSFSVNVADF